MIQATGDLSVNLPRMKMDQKKKSHDGLMGVGDIALSELQRSLQIKKYE